MENVILRFPNEQLQSAGTAAIKNFWSILKDPCTEHKLPVYSVLNINLPAHRYDCPDCMKQIEKELGL
jgi:hypothetical protein